MVDKNIFHLIGMPRAGNTLLGGIINQNSNLQVSPLSPLSRTVSVLHQSFEGETWENFDWSSEQDTLARKTAQAWYSDYKADNIIDRGMWFPEVVKRLSDNPKVIILQRDIFEVFASFIKWANQSVDNFIYTSVTSRKPEDVMSYLSQYGNVQTSARLIYTYQKYLEENNDIDVMYIDYKDLTGNTENVITNLYEFLEIDMYDHNFKDIKDFEFEGQKYNDSRTGQNLHKLKEGSIETSVHDIEWLFPRNLYNRWLNMNELIYTPEQLEEKYNK
tara:strand:- start:4417 stop:5238 length:822 start_codon:yes stop_codon:yes gene_type:complete